MGGALFEEFVGGLEEDKGTDRIDLRYAGISSNTGEDARGRTSKCRCIASAVACNAEVYESFSPALAMTTSNLPATSFTLATAASLSALSADVR
jgi:hypothetical protein